MCFRQKKTGCLLHGRELDMIVSLFRRCAFCSVLRNIPRKASASRIAMRRRNGSRSALKSLRKYLLCIYKVQQCCFEQRGACSKGQRNKYDKAKRNFPPIHAPFLIYHCHTYPFRQQRCTQCKRKAVFHTKRCGKRLNLLTLVALSFPYFNAQALECPVPM